MKPLMCVVLAGVLLGSATFGAGVAEADDDRKHWKHRRQHYYDDDRDHYRHYDDDRDHYRRGSRHGRYFSEREVYLVREYYRPRYRYERPRHRYYRSGYLPRGWHRRIHRYPVYVEREVIVLPHGYRRGIIDGHAVVYNSRGLILDVAVLF